jgi:hypothetical protein
MAAVFFVIEKDVDTTGQPNVLYNLSKLEFSANLIKLSSSFISQRTFRVSGGDEMSTPREIQAGVLQGQVLSSTMYSMYINDVTQIPGVFLPLFADDTCLYATNRKEGFILRKLQRGLSSMETWCERCNVKSKEEKTQEIYFRRRSGPPEFHLTLNGWNIPFINGAKYLGVIFSKRMAWRSNIRVEMNKAKALRNFEWDDGRRMMNWDVYRIKLSWRVVR